jgi:hypothetical protein
MRAFTRGELIGLRIAIVAAVGGLAFLAVRRSSPVVRDPRAELAGQRALLAQEMQALREEARLLHEERVATRKERMLAIAERSREGEARLYDRIVLRSACPYEVAVALHYQDLDDAWVTRGWWLVPPRESVTTDAMTRSQVLYFYAENQAVGRVWDGTGSEESISQTISDSRFDHVAGERFAYEGARTVSFFRRLSGREWMDYTEVFECPVEAPPVPGSPGEGPSKGPSQGQASAG